MTDYLRTALLGMKGEQERREAATNFARIVLDNPGSLSASLENVNKNGVYPLIHLLALSEGICPKASHMDSLEQVKAYQRAARGLKKHDFTDRFERIEKRLLEFDGLARFNGKTPQTLDNHSGQKTLVAADFIGWAKGMGWIAGDSREENLAVPRTTRGTANDDDKVTIPKGKTTNFQRAVFAAWDSGKVKVNDKAADLLRYLCKSDESGYIRSVNGDEITWENTIGGQSTTTLKALQNQLPRLRARYREAG
ncbi:hypothetical protein [Castellaniella sp.]|uniref:hypothetical protein n=1 Tax=Castellaniella sp. TaxID=1955812 RepID=UPI002AFFD000|nr:hypothetical protein [Castellaniella sp.]